MAPSAPRELPLRKPELQALFAAIGSEARLREILRAFYARMSKDTMLGFFFAGRDLVRIAENQGDFLLRALGERPSYSGKAPADAHTELPPILRGHFDRRLVLLRETLTAAGLPAAQIDTWVRFEDAFRDAIVAD
jgi:truncated hemoglobin YjbI